MTTHADGREGVRKIDLSVIAPCFNEEENVPLLVSRLLAVFDRRHIAGEIVLVNDASTDATGPLIDSLARRHHEVVAVHHEKNRGLSAGWDTGLAASNGTYVCFIDADLQNPPEEVWRLYREITQSHADLVQGVRSAIGRLKDGRYATSRVLNVMLNLTFGMSAADNKSGFVIALRDTMTDALRRRFRYRYSHVFIAVAAHANGFTFREVETLFQSRHAGSSFIKQWPVKLITDVCVDTAKAFVEFRLSPQPVEGLDQVLQAPHATRQAGLHRGWRRLLLELYFLAMAFGGPLITRRVRRMYQALERTQWLTAAEIRQLQEHRLRRLIRHAYHHVPFYRETFERLRVRPEEIQTLGDLAKLPLLSKRDVRENLYFDLFADNHRKREMQKVEAIGDDGEAMDFYVDRMQLEMRHAGELRALEWVGWQCGDRQVSLARRPGGGTWSEVIRERIGALLRRRVTLQANERGAGVSGLADVICRYNPALLDGSARSLSELAEEMNRLTSRSLLPKATISSAQVLSDDVRSQIADSLRTNVFDWYGQPEVSGIAHECNAHHRHIAAESYIVEVVTGEHPTPPGSEGEIVITDLNSFSVPLIRYRTGDRAVASDGTPCECGRGLPTIGAIRSRTSLHMNDASESRLRAIELA